MKALFLSESPLQLLNAIEAKAHFNIADNDANIVLLKGVSNKSFQQQLDLIDSAQWGTVYHLNYRFRSVSVFKLMAKIRDVIQQNSDVDVVFIGDYRTIVMRHVINMINPERTVLLDDGNATIHLARDRYSCIRPSGIFPRLKYFMLFKLIGVNDQYIKAVTFFTIYKIDPASPDDVIQNNYSMLKSKLRDKPAANQVIFIGCPFVETNSVSSNYSEESYFKYLREIEEDLKNKYQVNDILYVAHRREKTSKLETINSMKGYSVADFNEPLEIAISKLECKPLLIATFFSGAIDTLITMMDGDVKFVSYRLPETVIDDDKKDVVNEYYDYYEYYKIYYGMEVIKINSISS